MRVAIGDGAGHNWWCVVFPTMCTAQTFTEETAKELGLTGDEYRLITGETEGVVIKFRFMELLAKLRGILQS